VTRDDSPPVRQKNRFQKQLNRVRAHEVGWTDEPYAVLIGAKIFRCYHVVAGILLEDDSHVFVGESVHV
jgi:hypothetical protein